MTYWPGFLSGAMALAVGTCGSPQRGLAASSGAESAERPAVVEPGSLVASVFPAQRMKSLSPRALGKRARRCTMTDRNGTDTDPMISKDPARVGGLVKSVNHLFGKQIAKHWTCREAGLCNETLQLHRCVPFLIGGMHS